VALEVQEPPAPTVPPFSPAGRHGTSCRRHRRGYFFARLAGWTKTTATPGSSGGPPSG